MKGYVYVLWDKSEKDIFYVGATINPKNRLIDHRSSNVEYYFDDDGIFSSRKKDSSVNMSIIEEVIFENRDELNACESYWIHQFIAWGFALKNIVYRGYSPVNNRKRFLRSIGFDLVNGKVIPPIK